MEISVRRPFTARDRCDGCSARAKFLVVLSSGGELQFCGHHAEKFRTTLQEQGAVILDPADLDPDAEVE